MIKAGEASLALTKAGASSLTPRKCAARASAASGASDVRRYGLRGGFFLASGLELLFVVGLGF
jgi:hypothetical protein